MVWCKICSPPCPSWKKHLAKSAYRFARLAFTGLQALLIFTVTLFVGYRYSIMPDVIRQFSWRATFTQHTQQAKDDHFTEIILEKYPLGTATKHLQEQLRTSGFDYVGAESAHFTLMGLPCRYDWYIKWQQEAQIVTSIRGTTSFTCL